MKNRGQMLGGGLSAAAIGFLHRTGLSRIRYEASPSGARPLEDRIFFVNQDNWALPAVEDCLLDAQHFAPRVVAGP